MSASRANKKIPPGGARRGKSGFPAGVVLRETMLPNQLPTSFPVAGSLNRITPKPERTFNTALNENRSHYVPARADMQALSCAPARRRRYS
jgi:hypothetical protein